MGHTEGLTYVSAKGDGRYIISNGKDQAMRLWDLRKMRTSAEYDKSGHINYGVPNYDYRLGFTNVFLKLLTLSLLDTQVIQSPDGKLILWIAVS